MPTVKMEVEFSFADQWVVFQKQAEWSFLLPVGTLILPDHRGEGHLDGFVIKKYSWCEKSGETIAEMGQINSPGQPIEDFSGWMVSLGWEMVCSGNIKPKEKQHAGSVHA